MAWRSLAGLRVLVTGASSGIGRALVLELLAKGCQVAALARREDRLAQLKAERSGANLITIAGDVTNPADRKAALQCLLETWGGLDVLVNNAGSGAIGRFASAEPSRLRRVMEVNFFAPAEFTREALPMLRQGRTPLIVNVGSVLGHRAVPGKSEYCASKFALHGFSDALRAEVARDGIRVLLISPSTTASEFFDAAEQVGGKPDGKPPSRFFGAMTPETVARIAVRAMERDRHEVILSLGGKLLVWLDRLCPTFADWLIGRYG